MTEDGKNAWDRARADVIARWREIVSRIEARDEPGVLGLANVMDEFCDEADVTRAAVLKGQAPRQRSLLKFDPRAESIGTRCLFCRVFQEFGGCLVMLSSLNRLVLNGKWEDAGTIARGYLERLETMDLTHRTEPTIH